MSYKDEGCELHISCLDCLESECILDVRGGERHYIKIQRDKRILEAVRAGTSQKAIAKELGLSRRTIQRALSADK